MNLQCRALQANLRTCWFFPTFFLQGNRILWWKTEKDLDRGGIRVPEGQIILRGHAGKKVCSDGIGVNYGECRLLDLNLFSFLRLFSCNVVVRSHFTFAIGSAGVRAGPGFASRLHVRAKFGCQDARTSVFCLRIDGGLCQFKCGFGEGA